METQKAIYFLISIIFLSVQPSLAQRERVFAGCGKYTCQAGDVIRSKSMIFKDDRSSFVSTNLYCQLYHRDGSIVSEGMFGLSSGLSVGQLMVPDTVHFPGSFKWTPFSGGGFYRLKAKIVEEFGVYSLEVSFSEKIGRKKIEE